MSGPERCFVCAGKFGIFKKQHVSRNWVSCFKCHSTYETFFVKHECKGCHRTACKSCLSYNVVLPGQSSSSGVCKSCYDAIQNKATSSGRVSPPANFKRELEKKEEAIIREASNVPDPVDEQITDRLRKLKESYDRKDITVDEIQSRLQKLCASEPTVTMEELEYRLAKLKGSRPPAIRVHSIRKRPSENEPHSSNDTSEGKQVKRLIRQYTEEIFMETGGTNPVSMEEGFHPDEVPRNPSADDLIELARTEIRRAQEMQRDGDMQDEEISKRLSQITQAPPVPIEEETLGIHSNFHFDEEGMDEETANLIRRLMEEDRLEQNLQDRGISVRPTGATSNHLESATNDKGEERSKDEEFPWCFMCNDDATIRCLTCEDLFCKTCFRVVHDDSDMKGHRTEKFVSQSSSST